MTLNKKKKRSKMGDLNKKHRAKADKKMENRHADKPPFGLLSERRCVRGKGKQLNKQDRVEDRLATYAFWHQRYKPDRVERYR